MSRLLLVAVTILCSAGAALSRKMVSNAGVSPLRFELLVACMHAFMSYVMILLTSAPSQTWSRTSVLWTTLQAACSLTAGISFSYAMRGSNNLGALASYTSTTPLFTLLMSWLMLHEIVTLRSVLGALVMVLGAALIATR